MIVRTTVALALSATLAVTAAAQERRSGMIRDDQADMKIDATTSKAVVEAIIKELKAAYVFPETAGRMESDLRKRLGNNDYDEIKSAKKLAALLTDQLQAVSKDKHLRVFYSLEPFPEMPKPADPESDAGKRSEMRERMREQRRVVNFGFEKLERLEGNVGYLDLRMFAPAEIGGETAAAAISFLANTDALIIDLRNNGGGTPTMVALLCSYLLGPEPVHLNDLYFRPEDTTHQWWTMPHLPGKRYEGKPVYILTSKRTFSAAEEFTYNLKCLKRATIVGETTGGGAHPGGMRRAHEHFGVFVPSGRAINPISKTNWEGAGVTPDIPVPADRALSTAYLAALRQIAADLGKRPKGPPEAGPQQRRAVESAIKRLVDELAGKDAGKPVEAGRSESGVR
jgi:hypothetical protein